MTGALLYRMSGTTRYGHVALQDIALIDLDLFDEKSGPVEFVIVRSVGHGGIYQVCQRMASLLVYVGENGQSGGYTLSPDHVGYDADLAWRDTVIFEGCGDHDSVLFLGAAFGCGGLGG